jgi:hypothetical protein
MPRLPSSGSLYCIVAGTAAAVGEAQEQSLACCGPSANADLEG